MSLVKGPEEYLFGEETGLLEVVDGRPPFPRVAPPYRDGLDALGAAPTLANNVETMAHVACILANGPAWFREHGTEQSPGTIVCTVSGATQRAGVAEVAMGTPLRDVIDTIGGGPEPGRHVQAVLSGVAHPFVHAARLDTPLTYEDMEAAGSGLGACGFIVFDDAADMVAVAQGVARFLAVESCGQCTPCKQDGLAIAEILARFCTSNGTDEDVDELAARVRDGDRRGPLLPRPPAAAGGQQPARPVPGGARSAHGGVRGPLTGRDAGGGRPTGQPRRRPRRDRRGARGEAAGLDVRRRRLGRRAGGAPGDPVTAVRSPRGRRRSSVPGRSPGPARCT